MRFSHRVVDDRDSDEGTKTTTSGRPFGRARDWVARHDACV